MGRSWLALCPLLAGCQALFGLRQLDQGSDGGVSDGRASDSATTHDGPATSNITFVHAWSNQVAVGGTTTTVMFGTPPQEHDLIVVAIATWHNAPSVVADSGSNVYTVVPATSISGGGSNVYLYYAYNVHSASPFSVTVHTVTSVDGDNEVTAIAHDYSGALWTDSRDGQNAVNGNGSGAVVTANCGDVMPPDDELVVAAVTRDFNGTASVAPNWKLEASVDMDYTQYMVLATADVIFGPGTIAANFMLDHNSAATTWACVTAAFR